MHLWLSGIHLWLILDVLMAFYGYTFGLFRVHLWLKFMPLFNLVQTSAIPKTKYSEKMDNIRRTNYLR